MEIHILDVGTKQFGDCIIITQDNKTIMIDGAHPGDQQLLAGQIKKILNQDPPFNIDLLVVTHCHIDHIGCLPKLIGDGTIVPKQALVAEENLGFGKSDDGVGPTDAPGLNRVQKIMVAALQEEDHSNLPDDELQVFLQDSVTLYDRYIGMLQKMKDDGCKIIRYGAHKATQLRSLETTFKKFGLKILGPSQLHLVTCGREIAGTADAVPDDAFTNLTDNDATNLPSIYRSLIKGIKQDALTDDAGSDASAAKNDQSIMLKLAANGWKALLAGDMQFASAGVNGMDDLMAKALKDAMAGGPYDFIKLTHHTAENGLDEDVMNAYAPCKLYAHTGGKNDDKHPNKKALVVLKAHAAGLQFSRTDRNGMITVKKDQKVKMINSKGDFNNFSLNVMPDVGVVPPANVVVPVKQPVVNIENAEGDYIEVTARIPNRTSRVTITVDIDPEKKKPEPDRPGIVISDAQVQLGSGRTFPSLLFVTCRELLERNIGINEATSALKLIIDCPTVQLLEIAVSADAESASKQILPVIKAGNFEGVVIVGGYDVVPSKPLDVLDKNLRTGILNFKGQRDKDNFIVWSDDIYVDLDDDTLPELPISRIPDARRADVLIAALTAPAYTSTDFFAVRNIERPFAEGVFKKIPGSSGNMKVSETFTSSMTKDDSAMGLVYFMLHGNDSDSSFFWGETPDDENGGNKLIDAVAIANVPKSAKGTIVFSGCCWGALTVFPKAASAQSNRQLIPKLPEESIALAYLLGGAQAFIGCTGTHYSPGQPPYDYYGKPMHDIFWEQIGNKVSPAKALWESKKAYANELPHGMKDVFSRGIETKILRQFTCLGLGW